MTGTFHWIRVRLFCYSTENESLLKDVLSLLVGDDNVRTESSECHHGNTMLLMDSELTKEKDAVRLFSKLGKTFIDNLLEGLDDRVDDDCVFYVRLDKQKAVNGIYEIAHHGDVISITAKIVSHPARKNIAVENMRSFLSSL